jgi:hypothetical protein
VAPLLRTQEVKCSSLGPQTGYFYGDILWFPSAAECLKIRPHSLLCTDYLPDLTKSFLNLAFRVCSRKKDCRNGNKTETRIKGNWRDRKGVKKAKQEKNLYVRVMEKKRSKNKDIEVEEEEKLLLRF